ncbi:preprotein translocase subunit SecE [Castellaniella sp.]|uniref:preprotein translocase subunit SecE n=1 Tax=Castellaniella sp. TaxID=1955812 RepID=UPI002AFEC7F0|nr:preprotein translocase subunit SecE [Castellaniella sp.]
MSQQNVETVNRTADRIKLGLAVFVIAAGIVAYSVLIDQPTYVRVGAFIAGLIVAAVIVIFSDTGRRTLAFGRESYNETRRVVWPSRQETTRMTAIVFAFVVAMGILLWVADKLLGWIIYGLLLGWN